MAEAIMVLKSKMLGTISYDQVDISGFVPAFTPDEERLQQDITRIRKQYGRKESAQTAAEGDLLTVCCQSEAARFCKKSILVQLGKGLWNKELEAGLTGVSVDTEVILHAGDIPVTCRILKIARTILADLTDETVANWQDERFSNTKELHAYCIDKQILRFLDDSAEAEEAAAAIWQTAAKQGKFFLDEEEYETISKEYREVMNASMVQDETDDSDTVEEFDNEMLIKQMSEAELKSATIGQHMMEQEGKLLTEADYEDYLAKRAREGENREETEKRCPRFRFMKERYAEYYAVAIDAYVQKYFLMHMNPLR